MNSTSALIELKQANLVINQQSILEDINFRLDAGQIMSIIGPNGAGKTSLIRSVLGLQKLSSGEVLRKKSLRTAYMPQQFKVNSNLPISVGRFLSLNAKKTDRSILKRLGIDKRMNAELGTSSGGELQRILLARAILQEPELLVLDEPTQGVDLHGQAELYEIIEEFRQQLGCAILMVSHDLHVVMAKTDLVLCLNQHICCHGHPQEVSQHPEYIALFGKAHADTLAIYNHQHDHHHDFSGETHQGKCSHHEEQHHD